MMARLLLSVLLSLVFDAGSAVQARQTATPGDLVRAYEARRDSLIAYFAGRIPDDDPGRGGYFDLAARLYRGACGTWCTRRMDSLMAHPRGDMFWMYPFVTVMYNDRGTFPETTRRKMRDLWRSYTPYRGDTENHWALYYTSLYLAAQMYPGEPDTTWFTGKSSRENMEEARSYLISWMDLTTSIGQGEYDSPHYLRVYLAPMALLYAYAQDPAMRRRARMMLDYLLADFAAESLGGLPGGAHSRIYEREVIRPFKAPGGAPTSWLLFGNVPFQPTGETLILALSGYVPPAILHFIATDRSKPYVHRERKRTRHRIRYSRVRNAPVYKYTYVRPEYVLGSTQGGLLQPIQQQTWSLVWRVDDPREARNTLFSLHPYSSPVELGMYFAELQEFITEIVVRSKKEYDSPDKLTGGSPYEQVFQHDDALIALYDIPPGTRFPHVNAFFSGDLRDLKEDRSGWIFARGGDALIAVYPLAPFRWEEQSDVWDAHRKHRRLVSPHLKNGLVVQVAPAQAYASMDAFREAVRALPLTVRTEPRPSVRFTTLRGATMTLTYGQAPRLDGEPVDYDGWPLFDGPFLRAEKGSRRLELRYGPMHRLLDFDTLTIREWVDDSTENRQASGMQ
jgi:hypothetical protein